MGSFLSKYKLPLVAGILMLVVLPLALFLSQTPITTPRAAVDKTAQSKISLSGPQRVAPDQPFTVDIVVDTSKDPEFYLSGIDALIEYDPENLSVTQITDKLTPQTGLTLTSQTIDPKRVTLRATATGVQTASQPTEFTLASLTITPKKLGKTKLNFAYTKPSATDDTNLVGYKKDKPLSDQTLRERLLTEPPVYNLTIAPVQPSPPSASLPPTVCPQIYSPVCCNGKTYSNQCEADAASATSCQPGKCRSPIPSSTPQPSVTPTPTPTPKQATLEIQLSMLERTNGTITGTLYGIETNQVQGVTIAQGFDTVISRELPPTTTAQTIATFTTDQNSRALVNVPQRFQGKTVWLYVRTISHLVRKTPAPVTLSNDTGPLGPIAQQIITFTNLVPGDIYIAPRQTQQDNIINSFDAAELIKHLGKTTASADLNGDGSINTRDLQILLANLGQTGDPLLSQPTPTPSLRPLPSAKTITKPPTKSGVCPDVFNPVCGSDGRTYNNECEAEKRGLNWTRGTCSQ